jgi:hypothetical protein
MGESRRWRDVRFRRVMSAADWVRSVRLTLPTVCGCPYQSSGDGRDERLRLASGPCFLKPNLPANLAALNKLRTRDAEISPQLQRTLDAQCYSTSQRGRQGDMSGTKGFCQRLNRAPTQTPTLRSLQRVAKPPESEAFFPLHDAEIAFQVQNGQKS